MNKIGFNALVCSRVVPEHCISTRMTRVGWMKTDFLSRLGGINLWKSVQVSLIFIIMLGFFSYQAKRTRKTDSYRIRLIRVIRVQKSFEFNVVALLFNLVLVHSFIERATRLLLPKVSNNMLIELDGINIAAISG